MLPLPARSYPHLQNTRKLPEHYRDLGEDDALALVATNLGLSDELKEVVGQRFFHRGDRRLGFYTLLLASGCTWKRGDKQSFRDGDPLQLDPLADHPDEPAAKYLAACLDGKDTPVVTPEGDSPTKGDSPIFADHRSATVPGKLGQSPTYDTLLGQLAALHDLCSHWQSGKATQGTEAEQKLQRQRAVDFIRNARTPDFAWAAWVAIHDRASGAEFSRDMAEAALRFKDIPGLAYTARYEHARALAKAEDWKLAQDAFQKLFTETLDAGLLPPLDNDFCRAFQNGSGYQRWQTMIRDAAKKMIADARLAAVRLAWQVQQAGDPSLAEEVLNLARDGAPENLRAPLALAAVQCYHHVGQHAKADQLLQPLLDDKVLARWPALWRLAAAIAENRGMTARAIACWERALDIEYEHLPEKVNVAAVPQRVRATCWTGIRSWPRRWPRSAPSRRGSWSPRVVRAADRWRQLDTDPTAACQAAAKILSDLGAADLAWDYLTTPLAARPNEAAPWIDLAQDAPRSRVTSAGRSRLCVGVRAEPTNAQILWDRAQALLENGRGDEAQKLFRQIADGQWDPRFSGLQASRRQQMSCSTVVSHQFDSSTRNPLSRDAVARTDHCNYSYIFSTTWIPSSSSPFWIVRAVRSHSSSRLCRNSGVLGLQHRALLEERRVAVGQARTDRSSAELGR